MKINLLRLASAALGLAFVSAPAFAGTVTLPIPGNCGSAPGTNCLVFDNFTVYSLSLLNFQAGAGPISPSDPYAVSTNGQALQNAIVVGTGVNGQGSINTDQIGGGLVDNAYQTPNAGGTSLTNFATNQTVGAANSTQGAQGASIPNNSTNTWDITTAALNSYLNGGKLTFMFNLNQTNSANTYLNNPEDMLGWMAVTLRNDSGSVSETFYLDGNACTGSIALNTPQCDPSQAYPQTALHPDTQILSDQSALHDEWAYIHGQICVSDSGALLGFGSCQTLGISGNTVDQNLGANDAAFALYSDTLQTALNNPIFTVMSVDFRMAGEDNGYEQLLILSSNAIPQDVPEPLTVTIFGAGIAGLGLLRRRRSKA